MRRLLSGLATATLIAVGLTVTPSVPAYAAPPIWQINVTTSPRTLPGNGAIAGFEVACPPGQTPISGSYFVDGGSAYRLSEEVGYGSGARYSVTLQSLGSTPNRPLSVTAYCVPTTYFSNSTVKTAVYPANASGVAAGHLHCDPGWFALSARVTFSTFAGGPIRTSTPDLEFDGWAATGTTPAGSQMFLAVRCVPASDIPNKVVVSAAVPIGPNGTLASATCPAGMRPVIGGTWQDSGSGAISNEPRPFLPTRQWVSATYGGTGTMRTNVICIPSETPVVQITSGNPSPSPNSSGAAWSFTASDPAASGGYSVTTWCSLNGGSALSCTSPKSYTGLPDGNHVITVQASTSDGRWGQAVQHTVRVDTTPPALGFPDPTLYPTAEPEVRLTVTDADHHVTLQCSVDDAPLQPCGGVSIFAGQGTRTLPVGPLSDGDHVLNLAATDSRGNAMTTTHAFTVDATAPTVSQTTPTTQFTVGTAVTVRWSGNDATSGVASYDVRWRRAAYNGDFGNWTTVTAPGTATSQKFGSLVRGSTYCYSLRAVDHAGHTSTWTPARCTAIPLDDRDLARSSGWRALTPSGWFRQTALVTTTKGATLSVTGTTLKRVALVAQKCPTCGTVGIYVKGTLIAKVNLAASTTSRRTLVLPAFSLRTGTVTVKVLSSGKKVQVDALGVSRR